MSLTVKLIVGVLLTAVVTTACAPQVGYVELGSDFAPVQGQTHAMSRSVVVGGTSLRVVFELRDQTSSKIISRVGGYSLKAGAYSLGIRRADDVNGGDGLWVGITPPGDSLMAHVEDGKAVKVELVELRSSRFIGKVEQGKGNCTLAVYKFRVGGGPVQNAEIIMLLDPPDAP